MTSEKRYKKGYSIFGSDGNLHQVEYAKKSVSNSTPSIGIQVKDGVILLSQNTDKESKLLIDESIDRIHKLDNKFGMAVSGHPTDGRILANKLREYIKDEKSQYGTVSDTNILVHNISDDIQETIQSTELRPYGVSLLIGGINRNGAPKLYKVDTSGASSAWQGVAVGKNNSKILNLIENEYDSDMSLTEAMELIVNVFINYCEESISKDMISLSTITEEDGFVKQNKDIVEKLINNAGDKQ